MLPDQNTTTGTHLIWGRAASHGGFAYPFTCPLESLSSLPLAVERLLGTALAAATRDHIIELATKLPPTCTEVHMPFLERQELPMVNNILASSRLVEDAPGVFRVVREDETPEMEFLRQSLVIMAPALFPTPGLPVTIAFTLEKTALGGSFLP